LVVLCVCLSGHALALDRMVVRLPGAGQPCMNGQGTCSTSCSTSTKSGFCAGSAKCCLHPKTGAPTPAPAVSSGPAPVGFRASVTEAGLTTIQNAVTQVVKAHVKSGLTLPNVVSTFSAPILGNVDVTASNIKVSAISFTTLSLGLTEPNILSAKITGASATVSLNYVMKQHGSPKTMKSGSVTATPSEMTIDVKLAVTADAHRLHVQMTDSSFTLGELNVKFGQSWDSGLLNAATGWFNGELKSTIISKANDALKTKVNPTLESVMSAMPSTKSVSIPNVGLTCTVGVGFEEAAVSNQQLTLGQSFTINCQ